MKIFYVYQHIRNDTGVVFYVGKGKERRAYQIDSGRNIHWKNIVSKAGGFSVALIVSEVDEEFAHLIEIEAIDIFRRRRFKLANITGGGEGTAGLRHSDETKAVIKEKRKLQKMCPVSPETKAKIAASQRGVPRGPNPEHSKRLSGRKLSDKHKANIGAAHTGAKRSYEARAAMSAAQRGHATSDATRLKMSESHKGKKQSPELIEKRIAPLRGRVRDQETIEKIRASQKGITKNPESVAKMRAALNSPEVIAKISGENHWRAKRRRELNASN